MIKNIHASGRYVTVTGGNASTYINNYAGAQCVGTMRFNTTNQNMEVYDGNGWITIAMDHTHVGLNSEAEALLDWAKQKRDEERKLKEMMARHPGLKDLHDKFEIMRILCQEEEKQNELV